MRTSHTFIGLAFVALLGDAGFAAAQTGSPPALPRVDTSASVGWFSSRERVAGSYDNWYRGSWDGSLTAGYYWTEHLKTEVDVGGTSRDRMYAQQPGLPEGTYGSITHTFSTRRLRIGQHYQFGHNASFHPHVVAGVGVEWVRQVREQGPVFQYVPIASTTRVVAPPRTAGPATEVRVRPFVGAGFKAYMSERVFFRSDVRLAVEPRVKDAALTFGFGIDF